MINIKFIITFILNIGKDSIYSSKIEEKDVNINAMFKYTYNIYSKYVFNVGILLCVTLFILFINKVTLYYII